VIRAVGVEMLFLVEAVQAGTGRSIFYVVSGAFSAIPLAVLRRTIHIPSDRVPGL
jgi:hypothetical protein